MLQFQREDGFIPEMIFWGTESKQFLAKIFTSLIGYSSEQFTDITQMPMLPYVVRAIWNATKDVTLLEEFMPKIVAYFDWWEITRDPDGDGLISIIHPWESGIDATPLYDPALHIKEKNQGKFWKHYPKFLLLLHAYRKAGWNIPKILSMEKFNVEDVGVCSVYADGWGVLAKLAAQYDQNLASRCNDKQHFFENAIMHKCWDEKSSHFVSYFHEAGEERVSTAETVQSLFPLLLDTIPEAIFDKVIENLLNPEKFWLSYPVPSAAKSEISFNPNRNRLLWRGTMWPCTTWFVMEGLLKHDRLDIAKKLLDRWIDLYLNHGIWEYYNPLTGEGLGEEGIGMSTVIVDIIKRINLLD